MIFHEIQIRASNGAFQEFFNPYVCSLVLAWEIFHHPINSTPLAQFPRTQELSRGP